MPSALPSRRAISTAATNMFSTSLSVASAHSILCLHSSNCLRLFASFVGSKFASQCLPALTLSVFGIRDQPMPFSPTSHLSRFCAPQLQPPRSRPLPPMVLLGPMFTVLAVNRIRHHASSWEEL